MRLRRIMGRWIAICAAQSIAKTGDVYLDDGAHQQFHSYFTAMVNTHYGTSYPHNGSGTFPPIPDVINCEQLAAIEDKIRRDLNDMWDAHLPTHDGALSGSEENNNPARDWWNSIYRSENER